MMSQGLRVFKQQPAVESLRACDRSCGLVRCRKAEEGERPAEAGWNQRQTQHLNTLLSTSFARGWESRGGVIPSDPLGHSIPPEPYFEWRGEWDDQRGDMISYVLGGQGHQLRGHAEYVPRDVARAR
jgi:hypothetical protein